MFVCLKGFHTGHTTELFSFYRGKVLEHKTSGLFLVFGGRMLVQILRPASEILHSTTPT